VLHFVLLITCAAAIHLSYERSGNALKMARAAPDIGGGTRCASR
jgi:hypothetical protein